MPRDSRHIPLEETRPRRPTRSAPRSAVSPTYAAPADGNRHRAPRRSWVMAVLLLGLATSAAWAQTWTWSGKASEFQPKIKWSGRINAIARHPNRPRDILVATPVGGVFSSSDGGAVWRHVDTLPPHQIRDLAFSPEDSDLLIATAVRDFAIVWVPKVPAPEDDVVLDSIDRRVPGVSRLPARPATDLSSASFVMPVQSSNGGIWVSRDGGLTWGRPNSAVPLAARTFSNANRCRGDYSAYGISFAPATGEIYVGTDCGVARSSDGGRSWKHADVPGLSPGRPVYSVAALGNGTVLAGSGNGIFRSTDRGVTWALDPGSPGAVTGIHALGDSPFEGEAFAAVDGGAKLYHVQFSTASTPGTWTRITSAPSGGGSCGGIEIARAHAGEAGRAGTPSRDLYLYFGNQCRTYVTTVARARQSGALTFPAAASAWTRIPDTHADSRHVSLKIAYTASGGTIVADADGNIVRSSTTGGDAVVLDGGALADGTAYDVTDSVAWHATDGGLDRHVAIPPPRTAGAAPPVPSGPHSTPANPVPVGSGPGKINALQIYEVTGQTIGGRSDHIYLGTQDTELWASEDGGRTWPHSYRWEGFGIEMDRQVATKRDARVTFEACYRCVSRISGAGFSGARDWPDPIADQSFPTLIDRGVYVEGEYYKNPPKRHLARTDDLGRNWRRIASPTEELISYPRIWNAGQRNALLYQPVRVGPRQLSFYDGTRPVARVHLMRLRDLFRHGRTDRDYLAGMGYPAMKNFGSLGLVPRNFYWLWVYGVDTGNGLHLVAPDAHNGRMAESFDGGNNWSAMNRLTYAVTQRGSLRFVDQAPYSGSGRYFPLVSAVSFHPKNPNLVLVGTRQGGVYISSDRGRNWSQVPGSEKIYRINSLYWLRMNEVLVGTFGRGLWKIDLTLSLRLRLPEISPWIGACDGLCEQVAIRGDQVEPGGALIDLAASGDDSFDGVWLVFEGHVTSATVEEGTLRSVALSPGSSIVGFGGPEARLGAEDLPLTSPYEAPSFAGLPDRIAELASSGQVVGFTTREGEVVGAVLAGEALAMPTADETPPTDEASPSSPTEGRPYLWVTGEKMVAGRAVVTPDDPPLTIAGRGFDPALPVELNIDDAEVDQEIPIDPEGNFAIEVPPAFPRGVHFVVVRQGDAVDVSEFFIRHVDGDGP